MAVQWSSSSKSTVQDAVASAVSSFQVEYVTSGSMAEFNEGMFKNRPEVFSALPRTLDTTPELLVLVSRSVIKNQMSRHLVVLAALSGKSSATSDLHNLIPLDIVPIPFTDAENTTATTTTCQVDVQSGVLLQLQQGSLGVYDLTGALPKLKSSIDMDGAASFTRLSKPFILASSLDSMGLYNHQYRSIHSHTSLDWSELPVENQAPRLCQLISYLRSQDLAVALVDNVLVSIQVEPPKNHGKRRKEGLLIDSIGRGAVTEFRSKKLKCETGSVEFSRQVPGTMTEAYLAQYRAETEAADKLLANNELNKWEEVLRAKFSVGLRSGPDDASPDGQELPEWDWLPHLSTYPATDRRWVIYAISQVFSVDVDSSEDSSRPKLRLILPDINVTSYLVVAGHLTLSNLRAAFREELAPEVVDAQHVASLLVKCITEAEPSLTLLLSYLQTTKLSEVELLLAIRELMLSMDLIGENKLSAVKLLKSEAHDSANDKFEMDLDDLEMEIAVTEHYLGDESSSRSRGLTLAFSRLWRLPAISTVKALRAIIPAEEIFILIIMLRMELLRGAWTTLYIDPTSVEAESNEPPPDGVISLISDLLGRCIDAIGAGGWLFNDAMSAEKEETCDLLKVLKLEVVAALEGVEEAAKLNGILGEASRYGLAAQKSGAVRQSWNTNKPIPLHLENRESRLLPLGLKVKQLPTKEKIVSGGELVQRSMRETGHLISQKVEAYSLEKLAI